MILGYRLRRGATWGNAITVDDYKDAAVQVVTAYEHDDTVQEYAILGRQAVSAAWNRIGGATRQNQWSARGQG